MFACESHISIINTVVVVVVDPDDLRGVFLEDLVERILGGLVELELRMVLRHRVLLHIYACDDCV